MYSPVLHRRAEAAPVGEYRVYRNADLDGSLRRCESDLLFENRSFYNLINERLDGGPFLLHLLQHVLRRRLISVLNGDLLLGSTQKCAVKSDNSIENENGNRSYGDVSKNKQHTRVFAPSSRLNAELREIRSGGGAADSLRNTTAVRDTNLSSNEKILGHRRHSFCAVTQALVKKFSSCLLLKEKTSVLLIGPPGSGKTTALEIALREVQMKQRAERMRRKREFDEVCESRGDIDDINIDNSLDILVVRVDCTLYPNDAAVLRGIVLRLIAALQRCSSKYRSYPNVRNASFEDLMQHLKALLEDSCSISSRGVVIILNNVEVCCVGWGVGCMDMGYSGSMNSVRRQHLLYSLFDLQHGEGLHIFTACISNALDLTEVMERRIRSRFSMQCLFLSPQVANGELAFFIRDRILAITPADLLNAAKEMERYETNKRFKNLFGSEKSAGHEHNIRPELLKRLVNFCKAFSKATEEEMNEKQFVDYFVRGMALCWDIRIFLYAVVLPILRVIPPQLTLFTSKDHDGDNVFSPMTDRPRELSPLRLQSSPIRRSSPVKSSSSIPKKCTEFQKLGAGFASDDSATNVDSLRFASLGFIEHIILVGICRLHRQKVLPKTFALILQEAYQFYKQRNGPRIKTPTVQSLRRSFSRLMSLGVLRHCSEGQQRSLGITARGPQEQMEFFSPCSFPSHYKYEECLARLNVPSDLTEWLNTQSFVR